MARRWLLGSILLTPLAVWPAPIDPMQFRNAVFIVLGLLGVLWLVPNLWVRAFLGWTVVSFAATGATWWGMAGLLGLLAWALFYREASRLTEAGWRSVRITVLVACAIQVAWMGLQAVGADPLFQAVTWRGHVLASPPRHISGWLLNPMDAALFLGLAAPMLVAITPWLLILVALPILLWLKATAGLLALAVTMVWLFRTSWRLVVPMMLAAVVLYVVVIDPQGLGVKPTVWRSLAPVINRAPIIGSGPNALTYTVRAFQPVPIQAGGDPDRHETLEWNFAFNEWLQGALEVGAVGVALALGYLVALVRGLRGRWGEAGECLPGLLILLLTSLVSIPLRIGPVALLAALYLGRLDRITHEPV